jgi:hypothetical protein
VFLSCSQKRKKRGLEGIQASPDGPVAADATPESNEVVAPGGLEEAEQPVVDEPDPADLVSDILSEDQMRAGYKFIAQWDGKTDEIPADGGWSFKDIKTPDPNAIPPNADPNANAGVITYDSRIKAILDKACVACHSQAGTGQAPFMSTFAEAQAAGAAIQAAVEAKTMPKDPTTMSDFDRKAITTWANGGFIQNSGGVQ